MGPETLAQVLQPLRNVFANISCPELLIGLDISDDAAVYQVSEDKAIIQTLDFFTPIVDDPYDFGAIAAANSMSDVYAMGGEVLLALNICGFPCSLPTEVISTILKGGAEKMAEAGAILAGGHTVDDKEPKFGLSVMGVVHPQKILTKSGAQPGDLLILTKPLGVGIITTALKADQAQKNHMEQAVISMKKLNKSAAQLLQAGEVHACTDITGFALLGHTHEMAEKSGVNIQITLEQIPFLNGACEYAKNWLFPAGSNKNEHCYQKEITFADSIEKEMRMLLYTPETSGGLLAAIPKDRLSQLQKDFAAQKESLWVIGEVHEGKGIEVLS